MKRHYLILCLAVLVVGCNNPQKKAEKTIHNYLQNNLQDPSSYEPVSFSNTDSLFTQHPDGAVSPEATILKIRAAEFDSIREKQLSDFLSKAENVDKDSNEWRELKDEAADIQSHLLSLIDSSKVYTQKAAKAQLMFDLNGKFSGYKVEHKYRAKDKIGSKNLYTIIFHLDSTLTQVLGYEDI